MRNCVILLVLVTTPTAFAQSLPAGSAGSREAPSRPNAARAAEQFYANSNGEFAWTIDTKNKLRTTTWFAKNPAAAASYQQLTAVIYDGKPAEIIYLDRAAKRVVGRFDLNIDKFSLPAADAQKVRQAIDKYQFPAAGQLPRVEQMFEPLASGERGNAARLLLPPPTQQFPRLEHSTWDTSYMSADLFLIRSEMLLDGERGTYRLTEKPGVGQLTEIKYEMEGDEHVIRGKWALGRSNGWFELKVPPENLNVFWGQFGFQEGKVVGARDGVRKSSGGLKAAEKPVR